MLDSNWTTPWTSLTAFGSWLLWACVLVHGCECACTACVLTAQKNKHKKEPLGLKNEFKKPHGLQKIRKDIQKNDLQECRPVEALEKEKRSCGTKKENKNAGISRNADKILRDKRKKNNKTLISASGCKRWLWLGLWLYLAAPVFSTDVALRGGGQLRGRSQDMFDMSSQPGPSRAPLGRWAWKTPWAAGGYAQLELERQRLNAEQRGRPCQKI